jgi:uncharacterized protein
MKPRHRDGVGAVALETLAVTALALYLSLRLGSPLVWLFLPLGILLALRRSLSQYGFDLRFSPPSFATHLVLGATLLLLYAALHAYVAHAFFGRSFALRFPGNPPIDLAREFLAVGFPEEVFFRGYLQTRWETALPARGSIFQAKVGPAMLIQAGIFAVCHLATGDWTRLRVFFFALLAGWLRSRSGSVLPPAVYHAVANVWYGILLESFR